MRLFLQLLAGAVSCVSALPNVMFIVMDDVGYNDVSMHGSPQIPTPNIDGLCAAGTRLNNYYVQPVCSPTRATIMTGRHVINTGVYIPLSEGNSTQYLNLNYTLMPEYFRRLGYDTHMVGKWHLGVSQDAVLPVRRGFDTHLGFLNGVQDYYHHCVVVVKKDGHDQHGHVESPCVSKGGYDFLEGEQPALGYNGTYSAYTFTTRAQAILRNYSRTAPGAVVKAPFFLYLAFQNVHGPVEAPKQHVDKFPEVPNPVHSPRRTFCGMVDILDEAIGNVTRTLDAEGLADNTLVVLTSDNGGPTNGYDGNSANNYPLRGGKNTVWEGGSRVVGCAMGWNIPANRIWNGWMHASDWLFTLLDAVGGTNVLANSTFQLGDGMSVWRALSSTEPDEPSPRNWILYEAHASLDYMHGNVLQVNGMKIVRQNINTRDTLVKGLQGWIVPPGQDPALVNYTMQCGGPPPNETNNCYTDYCLFNLTADPCEYTDIASQHPEIVEELKAELARYGERAVPMVPDRGCSPLIDENGVWQRCA